MKSCRSLFSGAATTRFSDRAAAYAKHRPGYPSEIRNVLLRGLKAPLVVADIGAGTGISSQFLASDEKVSRVVAIEPNVAMKTEGQAQAHAKIEWRTGTGEKIPLADQEADVCVAFQAYHWFDPDVAWKEFVRVSKQRIAIGNFVPLKKKFCDAFVSVQYERKEIWDNGTPINFAAKFATCIRPFFLDATEVIDVECSCSIK